MADSYVNGVGVQTIKTWAEGKFATGEDLDALDAKVDEIIAEGGEPNVIETVKVNGTALEVDAHKAVDIPVPTQVSELANDSDFQTAADVEAAIGAAVSRAYKYKGSVATYADLPSSGNENGDVYDVRETGMNYGWNGSTWDSLGQFVDTSVFWSSQEGQPNSLVAMTIAEINAILNP